MFGGDDHKPQIFTQNDPSKHETQSKTEMTMTNSYNLYNFETGNKNVFFVTEKLNLPREQVVLPNSNNSSPSYGFKHKFSPATPEGKVRNDALIGSFYDQHNKNQGSSQRPSLKPGKICAQKIVSQYMKEAPAYDPTVDYYKEFWRLYLQNENLVCDIDMTASQNYRLSRKIFNIKDFYENTLVP